ncbi:MAG: RNA polymerase sigma factor [Solirubrobacteraceae bacterium]
MGGSTDREGQLLERARRGDAAAFDALVRAHQHVAFRTACVFSATPHDAEEAAQDAFVKAWRALPRFRAGAPFRPWLLAIVANEARSRGRSAGRRARREKRSAALDVAPEPVGPEGTMLVRERRAELAAALAGLPERDRSVLALRYLLELSERETAAALGCRPGTVKSRASRALERLRGRLEVAP